MLAVGLELVTRDTHPLEFPLPLMEVIGSVGGSPSNSKKEYLSKVLFLPSIAVYMPSSCLVGLKIVKF